MTLTAEDQGVWRGAGPLLEWQLHVLPRAQVPVPFHMHPAYASVDLVVTEWLLYVSITPEVLSGRRGKGKKQSSRISTSLLGKTQPSQKSYPAYFYLIPWARTRPEVTHSSLQERLENQLFLLDILLPRQNWDSVRLKTQNPARLAPSLQTWKGRGGKFSVALWKPIPQSLS